MIKCNNCDSPAEYEFSPRGAQTAYFCAYCVPWTLTDSVAKGLLPTVSAPKVEEAVAPEPTPEETVATKPTPRKKKAVADTAVEESPAETSEDATNVENSTDTDEAGTPAS